MAHHSKLYLRSLAEQQTRNAAALAAIESRGRDIDELDALVAALRARGWKAEALVETFPYGSAATAQLAVLLSCSEHELVEAIEYLAADGVHVARNVSGDLGCSRQYQLKLDRFSVRLHAYVHAPAKAAA